MRTRKVEHGWMLMVAVVMMVLCPLHAWADDTPNIALLPSLHGPAQGGQLGHTASSTSWIADDGLELKLDPEMKAPEGSTPPNQENTGTPTEGKQEYQRTIVRNGAYLLYWYQYDPNDASSFLHVLGLYWQRDRPDWRLDLVLPLGAYWSWKEQPDRWGLVTPLAWHVGDDDWSYTGAWLYHRWRSPTTSFDGLLPLFWHYGNRVSQDDLYVLGTAYWRRSPERKAFGVLPVFWGSSSTNATSWTLLPLAHYSAKPDKRMLLTPLFFARRNGPNRSSAGVLPLLTFWGEQDETQWGIQVPLGGYAHNSATGEGSGAVPLLLTFWDYSKDHATVAQFPLFMRSTDQNSTFQMLTPLLFGYHWEHPDMGMMDVAGALPLYLSYEDDETEFKLVTAALYARWRDPTTRFTMVGPLFGHTRAGRSTWGLAPLFGVQHDRVADVRRLLALPGIYWSDGPEHLTLVAGPLWSAHNDAGMRSDGVLPLFMRHRWADGSRVLWLPGALDIVSREAPKEELNWRFTWLLNGLRYANRISGQVTTAVAPLFVESHNRHTGDHWALTLPWVYTDGNTLRDTRRIIAPPFFYKRDDDLLSWMVVPLLFRHRDSQSDTTLVLPLWLDHASEGERLQLGPVLFGRYRREGTPEQQMDLGWAGLYGWYATETSRLRLLAPVWMDWAEQRDGIARELQVVAPIYGRYTETGPDGVTESTTAVGPLFGYEGREGSGFGLFPLIWHDRLRRPEGDRGHDVVFPLV
ncbi:MAG: hypothetical protein AAFS10_14510, partial [Myxococcota bacterium]